MAETDYGQLTENEFDNGIEDRVEGDDIEAEGWYMSRERGEIADRLGCFAIERLVVVREVLDVGDDYEVIFDIWDNKSGVVDRSKVVVDDNGFMVGQNDPSAQGYFIEYLENVDGSGVTEDKRQFVLPVSH